MTDTRQAFEAYFAASRKSKGAGKRPTFHRLEDGTYSDDHTQRHWWTWQQALIVQAPAPAQPTLTDEQIKALMPAPNVFERDRDDGWSEDRVIEVVRAALATLQAPVPAPEVAQAGDWEGAEEWMPLAWELCANENGEEACNELIWEGGPIPEPWGDRWMKYEGQAREMIAMVRKHVPAIASVQAPAEGYGSTDLPYTFAVPQRQETLRLLSWITRSFGNDHPAHADVEALANALAANVQPKGMPLSDEQIRAAFAEHDAKYSLVSSMWSFEAGVRFAEAQGTAGTPSPAPVDALREMEARKDAAYEERNRCVALIARMAVAMGRDVRVTRTAIEGWSDDWHGCIYIDLPSGQASWHFHDSQAALFAGLPSGDATWDGHDTPEKYRRVANAFATQGGSCASLRGEDPRGCWNVRCQLGAKCAQAPAVAPKTGGWVCKQCGIDRCKAACPLGHSAALTGQCPMVATAQSKPPVQPTGGS